MTLHENPLEIAIFNSYVAVIASLGRFFTSPSKSSAPPWHRPKAPGGSDWRLPGLPRTSNAAAARPPETGWIFWRENRLSRKPARFSHEENMGFSNHFPLKPINWLKRFMASWLRGEVRPRLVGPLWNLNVTCLSWFKNPRNTIVNKKTEPCINTVLNW